MGGQGNIVGGALEQMQRGQMPMSGSAGGLPSIMSAPDGRMSAPQQPMQGGGKSGGMAGPVASPYANSGLSRFGGMPMYQPPAYQPAIFQPPQLAPAQNMQSLFQQPAQHPEYVPPYFESTGG